jgi:hypothetical protein
MGTNFERSAAQTGRRLGFDLVLTTDKNVRYQQNLVNRKVALVVLGQSPWRLVRQHLDAVAAAVNAATPGSYSEVLIPFKKAFD